MAEELRPRGAGPWLGLGVAAMLGVNTATAQTAAPATGQSVNALDAVTSSATRTETSVRDVPGIVTVLDAEELERRGVQSIRDATRYEPGVTVGNQPARSGRSSYVIRGVGQNRVLITVDGVRVPDFPSNAQPGTFTRDYLDLESINALNIALQKFEGTVLLVTHDQDLIEEVGSRIWHFSAGGIEDFKGTYEELVGTGRISG